MAKTIKFNLICDGYPVRTLDDLQEHFNIEEILSYHKNGMLQRWLEVRGFGSELEAVKEVPIIDRMEAAKALVKIFGVETDEAKVEEVVYLLQSRDELKEIIEKKYSAERKDFMTDVSRYLCGYQELKERIAEHKNNYAALKGDIATLHRDYMLVFDLDYRHLFYYLRDHAPMAVYIMLAYDDMRKKYLLEGMPAIRDIGDIYKTGTVDEERIGEVVDRLRLRTNVNISHREKIIQAVKGKKSKDELAGILYGCNPWFIGLANGNKKYLSWDDAAEKIEEFLKELFFQEEYIVRQDIQKIYDELCIMTTNRNLKKYFSNVDQFHVINRNTDGNWKDVVQTGNKCMVLWIHEGCDVRANGSDKQPYTAKASSKPFLILDGIVFRSKGERELLYLEV